MKCPTQHAKLVGDGPLQSFRADLIKEGNWRSDPEPTGGGWFVDLYTYLIDTMMWLANADARKVSCFLTKDALPAERAITVHASLDNGALFSFSYTDGVDTGPEGMWGDLKITIAGYSDVIRSAKNGFELVAAGKVKQISSDEKTGGTTDMFVDMVTEGAENPAPANECARAVTLFEAA